ncbi:MAG: 2Fe-2S iron-sulfur cluster-binding protein [Pseudomonadota bacterium]|nr:2Fe-2S iron-sulfur cluster-binding protein [Pseudomonadota bacterium]
MSIAITINDKEYQGQAGQTVMEIAKANDIYIPHFCWHPGLSVAGVCRFCMVAVEGRPKLEIACNLPLAEGMKIYTANAEVEEAHKWALEFHLINHPLDCPICDQAGECGLQDYYMEVGKYPSQMQADKVLKPKALDVGTDLVLDTERCILCSRCVRFEEEVTKTSALGIFDRGDRSIIGTYKDKKIDHNYTTNLVDICPVGAFTSKDFRFQKRVWFTEEVNSICPGCSTGCAVELAFNRKLQRYYRVKPRASEVNGQWMCNFGRTVYKHLNVEKRLLTSQVWDEAKGKQQALATSQVLAQLAAKLAVAQKIGVLVACQYTNEEYRSLFSYFAKLNASFWQWRSDSEDRTAFDGILMRGDRNANSGGFEGELQKLDLQSSGGFADFCANSFDVAIVLAPELPNTFANIELQLQKLQALPFVSMWSCASVMLAYSYQQLVAMRVFTEKQGSFTNYDGRVQPLPQTMAALNQNCVDVSAAVALLQVSAHDDQVSNHDSQQGA